jgi:hypothetical protein
MRRWLFWPLAVLVIAIPTLVASALLWHFDQATLFDSLPVMSDEVFYWHQAQTFSEVGLNGGYYSAAELLPRAEFSHFYSWGLFTPAFYGSIGAILGWPLWAIAVLNLGLLAAATLAFIILARLKIEQLVWLGALLAVYHPLTLYAPSQYIEVLNMAFALAIAGGFVRLIQAAKANIRPAGALIAGTGLLIVAASLVRFPWAILLLPLTVLAAPPRNWRQWLRAVLVPLPVMLASLAFYTATSAPYPNTILERIARRDTLERKLQVVINNTTRNLNAFFQGDHLEIQHRVLMVLAIVLALAVLIGVAFFMLRRRSMPRRLQGLGWESALIAYTLGFILIFQTVIYELEGLRGYRLFSMVILLAIALMVAFKRRWILAPLLLYHVVVTPWVLTFYDNFTNFNTSPDKLTQYIEWKPRLAEALTYDAAATDPWCNTVLFDLWYLFGPTSVMIGTPAGFGLSITEAFPDGTMPIPPQAAYVVLKTETYEKFADQLDLIPMMDVPDGRLYRNQAGSCPP